MDDKMSFQRTNHLLELFRNYKRGIVIGTGMVTSVGGTCYWFWPTIQNTITTTTQRVLSREEIKTTASSLTSEVLNDDQTYQKVYDLAIRVLKTPSVQDATADLVCEVLQKPSVQDELKRLLIRTYNDPDVIAQTSNFAGTVVQSDVVQQRVHDTVINVLTNTIVHKYLSVALKTSIYGMFSMGSPTVEE
jgi:hypothetical protein